MQHNLFTSQQKQVRQCNILCLRPSRNKSGSATYSIYVPAETSQAMQHTLFTSQQKQVRQCNILYLCPSRNKSDSAIYSIYVPAETSQTVQYTLFMSQQKHQQGEYRPLVNGLPANRAQYKHVNLTCINEYFISSIMC